MSAQSGRQVVQGYPNRRGNSDSDSPYPTVRSGAEAILARRGNTAPGPVKPVTNPGAIFDSADAAALAMLQAMNPISISENVEHLSNIYQAPDGKYGFTDPARTGKTGAAGKIVKTPGRYVGTVHTHANYMDDLGGHVGDRWTDSFRSDEFSGDDMTFMRGKKDLEAGYLGTPSGDFYKWTRDGGARRFKVE